MSLLNFLQFQAIDINDDIPDEHKVQDQISLDDQVDEASLDEFWNKVIEDIHKDPKWFSFTDE